MKPGAYVELSETGSKFPKTLWRSSGQELKPVPVMFTSDDGSLTPDNAISRWCGAMVDAVGKTGHVTPSEEQLRANLENSGFVDVQTFTLKQPIGPWAKAQYVSLGFNGAMSFRLGTSTPYNILQRISHLRSCLNRHLKKLGLMLLLVCEQGFHSYGKCAPDPMEQLGLSVTGLLAFTKILGMDPQEAQQLCDDTVSATRNKNVHCYCP
jgi:hypothetical protein